MEKVEIRVQGPGANGVSEAVRELPDIERANYRGDAVVVFAIEQFYARNFAELQATVVLERIDETTCEGVILAGGGGVGVAKVTLGAEKSMADDVLETIETYCENNDLALEKRGAD